MTGPWWRGTTSQSPFPPSTAGLGDGLKQERELDADRRIGKTDRGGGAPEYQLGGHQTGGQPRRDGLCSCELG